MTKNHFSTRQSFSLLSMKKYTKKQCLNGIKEWKPFNLTQNLKSKSDIIYTCINIPYLVRSDLARVHDHDLQSDIL